MILYISHPNNVISLHHHPKTGRVLLARPWSQHNNGGGWAGPCGLESGAISEGNEDYV